MMVGTQLRRYREASGTTPEQAAYAIRRSRATVSRLENGLTPRIQERDVADLLALYGVTGDQARAALLTMVRQSGGQSWWAKFSDITPGWLESYLGLEEAAERLRTYEVQFVHGLFQTEDYARAVTTIGRSSAAGEEIERRVSLRLARQEVLTRPDPPHVWSIMDEAALRRPIGGRSVMLAQLTHLAEVASMPGVTLQVVPFASGGHAAAGGSFTILRFAEPELRDVVYIEQLASALYIDHPGEVDYYMEVMDRLSAEAATPASTHRVLAGIIRTF